MIFLARGLIWYGTKGGDKMSLDGCKTFTIVINIVLFLFTLTSFITEILVFTKGDKASGQDVTALVAPLKPFTDCSDTIFKTALSSTADFKQEDFATGLRVCSLILGVFELVACIVLAVVDLKWHKATGVGEEA